MKSYTLILAAALALAACNGRPENVQQAQADAQPTPVAASDAPIASAPAAAPAGPISSKDGVFQFTADGNFSDSLNESSLHAFIRHQRHTRHEQRMNLDLSNIIKLLPEFYKALGETFIMVGISSVFGIVAGGLLGVWLFVSGERQLFANAAANRILNGVISLMRAFPFVILMIVLMPLTRLIVGTSFGPTAASVSLSVAASFYFARLVEQNLKEVPRGVVEAAQAMGATPKTIIFKVLLSEARSGLVLSITILMIAVLGESAAAGLIGGGGIGDLGIRYGHQRYMPDVMAAVVLVLTLMVIVIQSIGNFLSARLNKR